MKQPAPPGSTRGFRLSELRAEMEWLGVALSDAVLTACMTHWELLSGASPGRNLISRRDLERGPLRHTADSLACLARWPLEGDLELLDIGSGGGLPGIPLAIARPSLKVTLLDSRERKTDWLRRTVRALGLQERVGITADRLDQRPVAWIAGFDVLTARAVAPPDELLDLVLPVLGEGSMLLLWHSDRQKQTVHAMIDKYSKRYHYDAIETFTYLLRPIDFLSNISCIRRLR